MISPIRLVLLAVAAGLVGAACADHTKPEPVVVAITPNVVSAEEDTPAVVTGEHFLAEVRTDVGGSGKPRLDLGFTVRLAGGGNERSLPATFVDTQTLEITIPAGMVGDVYDVTVITPGARTGTLPAGLRVLGVPVRIMIEDAPGGAGTEVGSRQLTTDESVPVYAVSRDARNGFVADEEVTWEVAGEPIGWIEEGPATSAEVELTTPGSARVIAVHPTLGEDATGELEVAVGAPARALVVTSEGGPAVGSRTLVVGTSLPVYASGYDLDDNYTGPLPVSWTVLGGIGAVDPTAGTSTVFTPDHSGTGNIRAGHETAADGLSGAIEVLAGDPVDIEIVDAPDGGGEPVADLSVDAGEVVGFFAVSVDALGNFCANENVSWNWALGCGLDGLGGTGSGESVTFSASAVGTCKLHATGGLGDDDTGDITVVPGPIAAVRIEDGAEAEVAALSMVSGEERTLWAVGFDQFGNRLGDTAVTWDVEPDELGTLSSASPDPVTSKTLTAVRAIQGTVSVATPVVDGDPDDVTGTISVSAGAAASLNIESGPDGSGTQYSMVSLPSSVSLDLFAVARDAAGNVVAGDCDAAHWATTLGGGASIVAGPGCTTLLTSGTEAASGVVTADDWGPLGDASVPAEVSGLSVDLVRVSTSRNSCVSWAGGAMTADDQVTLYAVGCTSGGAFVGQVSAGWSIVPSGVPAGGGELSTSTGTSTTFFANQPGELTLHADDGVRTADTGLITISPGTLARIRIDSAGNGGGAEIGDIPNLSAGTQRTWYATGRDADGNFVGLQAVAWSVVDNPIGTVTTPGESTSFTATRVGTGRVRADHGTAQDDATGVIQVVPGAATQLSLEDAAGGVGAPIGSRTRNADQYLDIYAIRRDAYGNYVTPDPTNATWSVNSPIGTLSPQTGASTRLTFVKVDEGVVTATAGSLTGATGTLTVTPGALYRVVIEEYLGEPLDEIGNLDLSVGERVTLFSVGRDADGNARSAESVTWSITNPSIGVPTPSFGGQTDFTALEPGSGVISANHATPGIIDDTTGTITVLPLTCGNDVAEGSEVCDGDDLRGQSCWSLGVLQNGGGGLRCALGCLAYDFSGCIDQIPINRVDRLDQALTETYGAPGADTISIVSGTLTLGQALVIDECPSSNCPTGEPAGVTLRALNGPVTLHASCAVNDQWAVIVRSPKNRIVGLRIESCAGGVLVERSAPNTTLSHNALAQWANNANAALAQVHASDCTLEANHFVAENAGSAKYAINLEGQNPHLFEGNKVAMNAIYGAFTIGIRVYYSTGTRPTELAHNSIWWGELGSTSTVYGVQLVFVGTGVCYHNNIISGHPMSTGLVLTNISPAACAVPSRNNVNLGSGTPCTGPGCGDYCGALNYPFCDLNVAPGFADGYLCLGLAGAPLIDDGVNVGWDMNDEVAASLWDGNGPEVGARENGVGRRFGGLESRCVTVVDSGGTGI
jgi:hypothetical protein